MVSKKRPTRDFPNPKDEGSSKVVVKTQSAPEKCVEDAVYRLYFKGLMSDEIPAPEGGKNTAADGVKRTTTAGLGVAICDQTDKLLFEMKEAVTVTESDAEGVTNRKDVEIRALIRGLSKSLHMGIRNVVIYCTDVEIYQLITGKCSLKNETLQHMEEVGRLRNKFASSKATLVSGDDIKFAYELASDAISSQASTADADGHDKKNEDDDENDNDDYGEGHDGDGHDYEDDNPWAYGCGCDFGTPDSPASPGVDIDTYIEYYSL